MRPPEEVIALLGTLPNPMDESEEERFYRAVREGDLAWIYSHPDPTRVDLDKISRIYAAHPHSGMHSALVHVGLLVRWTTPLHVAGVLHACHGHTFSDAILNEASGATGPVLCAMLCAFDAGRLDHIVRLAAALDRERMKRSWREFFDKYPDVLKKDCRNGRCAETSERLDRLIRLLDERAFNVMGRNLSQFVCCDPDRSAHRLFDLFQKITVSTPSAFSRTFIHSIFVFERHVDGHTECLDALVRFVFALIRKGAIDWHVAEAALSVGKYGKRVRERLPELKRKAMAYVVATHLPVEGVPELVVEYVGDLPVLDVCVWG